MTRNGRRHKMAFCRVGSRGITTPRNASTTVHENVRIAFLRSSNLSTLSNRRSTDLLEMVISSLPLRICGPSLQQHKRIQPTPREKVVAGLVGGPRAEGPWRSGHASHKRRRTPNEAEETVRDSEAFETSLRRASGAASSRLRRTPSSPCTPSGTKDGVPILLHLILHTLE